MKKLITMALMTLAPLAMAQDDQSDKTGVYFGIGSTGTVLDIEGTDDDPAVSSLSFKLGYAFNENVAIEGRFIGESNYDDIGYGEKVRLDSGEAVYLRLSLGNPTFDPYILIGYASLEATLRGQETYYYYGYDYTASESGFAFGLGANWKINELISITGDWTLPAEDVVQFNIGLDFKF